jgi:hypothetical protein
MIVLILQKDFFDKTENNINNNENKFNNDVNKL